MAESCRQIGSRSVDGCPASTPVGRFWPWRAAPAGGLIVEECRVIGVRAHLAEPADVPRLKGRRQRAPRPTGSTRAICACCWRPTSCRSRGSHPSMCWRSAPRFGSTWTCSRRGVIGCNASTRRCSSWVHPRSRSCWAATQTDWHGWKGFSPSVPHTRCMSVLARGSRSCRAASSDVVGRVHRRVGARVRSPTAAEVCPSSLHLPVNVASSGP